MQKRGSGAKNPGLSSHRSQLVRQGDNTRSVASSGVASKTLWSKVLANRAV